MSGTMKRCIRLILFPALLAALLASGLSFFVASAPIARAQALNTGNTSQAVQLDSPAVVRILSQIAGQVVCYGCANDGSNIVSPQSGAFMLDVSGSGAFIS